MRVEPRFERLLKEKIGLDALTIGAALLERAVRRRIDAVPGRDAEQYWAQLQHSESELQALIEAVIVPETWFFRYPESFATLARLAFRRVAELKGSRPLRILSLPCSTGEEPYSIAMSLFDGAIAAEQFQIDALDVSPLSIERAKRAVYGRNSFRGASLAFRGRHFTEAEEGYALHENVCRQVRFQRGNLLEAGLLADQPAYDFVFCRNLLIYFDVATQERVLGVLKRLTRTDGVLFIGPAEASLFTRVGMQSLGIPLSFAFRRQAEEVSAVVASPPTFAVPPPRPAPVQRERGKPVAPPPLRRIQASPLSSVAPDGGAAQQLESIATLANQGRSAQARQRCHEYLAVHGPAAEVFYWLGLLSDVDGDAQSAQGYYRKALYLQPQHPAALAHLAALLRAQGDSAGAQRLQARAARGVNTND